MIRYKIIIKGITQGVGFRPFIYNLAVKYSLSGFVKNIGFGVIIEAESTNDFIDNFISDIQKNAPLKSQLDSIEYIQIDTLQDSSFQIIQSDKTSFAGMFFPVDFSLCPKCEEEIQDKNNRRFNYAFISCVDCGPRYSIITDMPFDRQNSSMHEFELCNDCLKEYENPNDRRFHFQGICCPECGPKLDGSLDLLAQKITNGEVVALKGVSGFNLICDATNENAVQNLRNLKRRPAKPLAVMFKNIDIIQDFLDITKDEKDILLSIERPIVLVKKGKKELANSVVFESGFVGAFLPYSPIHFLLCNMLDIPIVVTSANLSSEPILIDKEGVQTRFKDIFVLSHNREIKTACDDSVVRVSDGKAVMLRNARGYAPKTIKVNKKFSAPVLCVGAHQKSTVSFGIEDYISTSPYIADLDNISSIERFEQTIEYFKKCIGVEPKKIVCDLHPKYTSSIYAKNLGLEVITLQHHKAHFYAALYDENLLETPSFGAIWDGNGYGEDGNMWGGEFFYYDGRDAQRVGGFEPFYLLGGERAAKEPRLCALSFLFEIYGKDAINLDLPTTRAFSVVELENLWLAYDKKLGVIKTSSVGRLFDAAASILGLLQISGYEGQSGLLLEGAFNNDVQYNAVSPKDIICEMIKRPSAGSFFATLSQIFVNIAKDYKVPIVATGGVFLNSVLRDVVLKDMQNSGVYFRVHTKPNDEAISFGQAIYALQRYN